MDIPRQSDFRTTAIASGLVECDDLDAAEATLRGAGLRGPITSAQIAEMLVDEGRINRWQAEQLLAGRSRFNLGPYQIIDSIGQGGMGQVFRAEHTVMGRIVAVKVLPRHRSTPEAIYSFQREIRAQAQLDHENLVRALDAGHDGNVHYLITEYVPGTDLRRLVRRAGPLQIGAATSIVCQAARGLGHAHDRGLIHRDVKPGNVLVTPDGRAKVSDLGLASNFATDEIDIASDKIVGTADYLSPEQIMTPDRMTPTSDIYSLGCTLYYALTGKVPFPGGSPRDKARAHCHLQPIDPRRLNPELSGELVDVIADMMAKSPADRPQSTGEVIAALAPWQSATPVELTSDRLPAIKMTPARTPAAASYGNDGGNLSDTQPSFTIPRRSDLTEGDDSASQGSLGTVPVVAADEDTLADIPANQRGLARFDWFGLPPLVVGLIALAIFAGLVCLAAAIWQPI